MKEIVFEGELYVRKKDISLFLKNETRYRKSYSKYYNLCKEIIEDLIQSNNSKILIKDNIAKIPYIILKDALSEKNMRETIFLKNSYDCGLIIKNTQGKYKHQTSIDGEKVTILKVDLSVLSLD